MRRRNGWFRSCSIRSFRVHILMHILMHIHIRIHTTSFTHIFVHMCLGPRASVPTAFSKISWCIYTVLWVWGLSQRPSVLAPVCFDQQCTNDSSVRGPSLPEKTWRQGFWYSWVLMVIFPGKNFIGLARATLFDDDGEQYFFHCIRPKMLKNISAKDFMYETINTRYRVCFATNWIAEAMLAC